MLSKHDTGLEQAVVLWKTGLPYQLFLPDHNLRLVLGQHMARCKLVIETIPVRMDRTGNQAVRPERSVNIGKYPTIQNINIAIYPQAHLMIWKQKMRMKFVPALISESIQPIKAQWPDLPLGVLFIPDTDVIGKTDILPIGMRKRMIQQLIITTCNAGIHNAMFTNSHNNKRLNSQFLEVPT